MAKNQSGENGNKKNVPNERMPIINKVAVVKNYLSYVTVEPLLACYVLPSVLASIAVQNLNLEKACRVNKQYGDEICDSLIEQNNTKNNSEYESEVQAEVAYMMAWRLPLQTTLPAIIILFVGAWSDKTGKRKPCMLVPMVGEFLTAFGLILCTYYFLEWPLEMAGIFEGLPPAMLGGWATMFMAIFSYLADHTSDEERTFRIGIVNVFISVAIPIGTALSGIMVKKLGYYGVFGVCMCIYVIGFIYTLVRIKDKKVEKVEGDDGGNQCIQILNYRHVLDTFMVLFKKRKYNRSLRTKLLVLVYILLAGPVHGAAAFSYLYARIKFHFTEVEFSIFSSYAIFMNFVGVLIGLTILSKLLKMDDSLIGALACISKVLASFVYAFAPSKYWFYAAPIVELIGGTAVVAMRSIATKIVETDEIGKINAYFGICDAIVNAIYGPIFAAVYIHTSHSFQGAYCVLAAFLTLPTVFIFIYMFILQKRENAIRTKEEMDATDNMAYESEVTAL